jgi:PAS domain S-box-containing protein
VEDVILSEIGKKDKQKMLILLSSRDTSKDAKEAPSHTNQLESEQEMQPKQKNDWESYGERMLALAPVRIALFEAREWRLLAANPSYEALLPSLFQNGQALGHGLTELFPTERHPQISHLFQQVMQTTTSSSLKAYAMVGVQGDLGYWDISLSPYREEGQVKALLLTMADVTHYVHQSTHVASTNDHEQMLTLQNDALEWKRLKALEILFASLQNTSSPQALAQAVLDAIKQCFTSDVAVLYGTQKPGVLSLLASSGESDTTEFPHFPASLMASDHSEVFFAMQQLTPMKNFEGQDGRHYATSYGIGEGGLRLPPLKLSMVVPLWGKHCEGVLLVGWSDSDEQEELFMSSMSGYAQNLALALAEARHHEAISNEQQRMVSVLDQLPEGILLVEARSGKVRYANPTAASLLGSTLPHLIGTSLNQSALLSPYGLDSMQQQAAFRWNFALIDALWGKPVSNQEMLIKRPDGSQVAVLSSAAPIRTTGGLIREAVMVFQDISDLKQLEQQKSEFFAIANHELRTPLTIIAGFAELLALNANSQSDEMERFARTSILQECENLQRLIADLLDATRLEYVRLELKLSTQDLLAPLVQLVNKHLQTNSTHQFSLQLQDLNPQEKLMGRFDIGRCEQILNNLISNAIKYSPVGSSIEVGIRPNRDRAGQAKDVLLWAKDHGSGIAAIDLPHLFERFYRVNKTDESVRGFGIGLYLTRELVTGHGGRVWVESTEGFGSTFFVTLPLTYPHE